MTYTTGVNFEFFKPEKHCREWTNSQLAMATNVRIWWKAYFFSNKEKYKSDNPSFDAMHFCLNGKLTQAELHARKHAGEGYEGILKCKTYSKKWLIEVAELIGLQFDNQNMKRIDMIKAICQEVLKAEDYEEFLRAKKSQEEKEREDYKYFLLAMKTLEQEEREEKEHEQKRLCNENNRNRAIA